MSDFGIFAQDVRAKVTQELKKFGKVIRIPVSIGFKSQDKWANEFFDIVVFEAMHDQVSDLSPKDQVTVSGRVQLTEWTDKAGNTKKRWEILARTIETSKAVKETPPAYDPLPDDDNSDVPF